MKDYYAILDLGSDASPAEVTRAYRRKAQQWHPDRNPAPEAADQFRDAQEAYETLADAQRRHAYDENRRRNLLDQPLQTARAIWQHYLEGVLR